MKTYYVGDTYPPMDFLLKRRNASNVLTYVDPSGASQIVVKARINGVHVLKQSANLSNNVSIVVDGDGYNRIRLRFVEGDLDTEGIYQVLVRLIWTDGSESVPEPYEFKVVPAWN